MNNQSTEAEASLVEKIIFYGILAPLYLLYKGSLYAMYIFYQVFLSMDRNVAQRCQGEKFTPWQCFGIGTLRISAYLFIFTNTLGSLDWLTAHLSPILNYPWKVLEIHTTNVIFGILILGFLFVLASIYFAGAITLLASAFYGVIYFLKGGIILFGRKTDAIEPRSQYPNIAMAMSTRNAQLGNMSNSEKARELVKYGVFGAISGEYEHMGEATRNGLGALDSILGNMSHTEKTAYLKGEKVDGIK